MNKAMIPKLKEGDLVRVRKPVHVRKGESKFSDPMQIIMRKGTHCYKLSDGQTWNVSHLALLHTDFTLAEQSASTPPLESVNIQAERYCCRRMPMWLKDYVTSILTVSKKKVMVN